MNQDRPELGPHAWMGELMLKFLASTIGIIFLIGLIVIIGLLMLIF